jgi:hypothetical protein
VIAARCRTLARSIHDPKSQSAISIGNLNRQSQSALSIGTLNRQSQSAIDTLNQQSPIEKSATRDPQSAVDQVVAGFSLLRDANAEILR